MIDLDDHATAEFLHSGCALLVCTVGSDGLPRAGRGWGMTVVDAERGVLRILLEADDPVTVANVRAGGAFAVTATNVSNFRSVQFKGRGLSIEQLTPADEAKREHYTHDFLADVHAANGYPSDVLARWAARPVVPCHVIVDASFDQTPGPSAGAVIDKGTR